VDVFTIGHSTHTADAFVALLQQHAVRQIADVRTVPRSRRHPHFAADALARTLEREGVVYCHFPALGGLRRPRPDSIHTAWTHPSFRGYADHMDSSEFGAALEGLMSYSSVAATAVMCAEALWWQCHRRLIADALTVRRVEVVHILASGKTQSHEITPFARILGDRVWYPGLV
jgi:uncharacterized protein (DUF488 family)